MIASSESDSDKSFSDVIEALSDLVGDEIVMPEPFEPDVKYEVTQEDCVPTFGGPKPCPSRFCEWEMKP